MQSCNSQTMRTLIFIILLPFLLLPFFDVKGQNQPPGDWEKTWEMKPGVYRVLKQGQVGIVNAEGAVLVPCQFDQVYDLTDDNFVRVLKNLKIGLYHLEKGIILPAEYDQIWPFEGEMAKVLKNRKMGYVNKEGLMIIPIEYNHIWPEEEGLIKVLKDGRMGFFDISGNLVLPAEYQQIWSFEDGMARILKDGKMGYADHQGNVVIPPIYDQVWGFRDGIAKAMQAGEFVYIDQQGRVVEAPPAPPVPPIPPVVMDTTEHTVSPVAPGSGVRIGPDRVEITRDGNTREIVIRKQENSRRHKIRYFEGHLAGVNLGVNSYLDAEGNEDVPAGYGFMQLNHEKSVEFSVYPVQQDIRLIGSYFGMVTSMGLKYNNYRFDLVSPLDLNEIGQSWFPVMPDDASITKSKLTVLWLTVPLMLEIQIPDGRSNYNGFYLAGGVEGSLRLRSHTKVIYHSNNTRLKRKNKNDFDLNGLQYSFIARAGYRNIGIFGSYTPQSMFKTNKGPELYPFTIGLSFNFN